MILFSALHLGDYGTLLIDEPEISLHTFAKDQISRHLFRQQDFGVMVVTHSEDFISVANLPSTIHCVRKNSETVVHSITSILSEVNDKKAAAASISREITHMYFAERALFVEGPTDIQLFSALFWLIQHDERVAQLLGTTK